MKHAPGAVAASVFVAVAVLLLSWTTYFAQLNSSAYDFTLRLAGPAPRISPVLIVAIDEDSLARIGNWPWSRDKLANIIERIQSGGPRVIAVDLLLDDSTSAAGDAALTAAIAKTPSIVLATRIDSVNGASRWRRPNPAFSFKHVRLGHVHAEPDFDGISRRIFSAKLGDGQIVQAFAIEVLRGAGLQPGAAIDDEIPGASIIRPQAVNIRFTGDNGSFPLVPAWKVLDGSVQDVAFKDQIVLIGSTAEGLGDQWFTPFAQTGRKMSGVEIHANAIETLYTGRSITDVTDLEVFAGLFAMIMLLWRLDGRFEGRPLYAAAILASPAIIVVLMAWLLMKYSSVWLPFPDFLAAIVIVVPGLEVWKIVRVNRDLDGKIGRLTAAELYERRRSGGHRQPAQWDARERILPELSPGAARDSWLAFFESHETESRNREAHRINLFGSRKHNSRWKLDAVDFFSEELMRFLAFNNAILASIEDVIMVSDPAGRVVYQNPAARRLEGFRDEPPFAPDYFAQLLDGRTFISHFANVLATTEPVAVQFVPARNGHSVFNVTLSPIARLGVVFTLHDATAQYELNQAKNDMVSLVSHELRTPLTSIRGYSDMLLKYDLVQEKGREFLRTIIDEGGRLNALIQSFLDIAYIESGRQKITKTGFEIGSMLRDLVTIVGPVAAEKQIRIETPVDGGPMAIQADRLLLYQALTNLVTNAVKYSMPGTTVRIAVANGNGRVRFLVADQGFGIPPVEQTRIFEKFYRRANKETREQSGFGLGLAFVKEVAMRHGGDVIVDSEVGKGSVFTLSIPN